MHIDSSRVGSRGDHQCLLGGCGMCVRVLGVVLGGVGIRVRQGVWCQSRGGCDETVRAVDSGRARAAPRWCGSASSRAIAVRASDRCAVARAMCSTCGGASLAAGLCAGACVGSMQRRASARLVWADSCCASARLFAGCGACPPPACERTPLAISVARHQPMTERLAIEAAGGGTTATTCVG